MILNSFYFELLVIELGMKFFHSEIMTSIMIPKNIIAKLWATTIIPSIPVNKPTNPIKRANIRIGGYLVTKNIIPIPIVIARK